MTPAALPRARISGFYFFYFAILGVMVPYWTPYLASIGYSPLQIGYLTGISLAAVPCQLMRIQLIDQLGVGSIPYLSIMAM